MAKDATTLSRAISLWEGSLRTSRKAPRTIDAYIRAAQMIEDYLGRDADPATITVEDLEAVVARWQGISATTVQNRLVAWRMLFQWGRRRYGWPDPTDGLELPRKDKPVLRRLRRDEVDAMLAQPPSVDHTAVVILAYTGLRRGELMSLRWSSIDLVAGTLRVFGKGRKGREVPLRPELIDHLARVKDDRGAFADDDCFVFPARNPSDRPAERYRWYSEASDNTLDRAVKRIARAAGVRNPDAVTSHMFRRYLLEMLLEDGVSPYIGAAIAGHASIQTTAQYGGGASLAAARLALSHSDFVTPPPTRVRDSILREALEPSKRMMGFEPTNSPDLDGSQSGLEAGGAQVTPVDEFNEGSL